MSPSTFLTALAYASLVAASNPHSRQASSGVAITDLSKSGNATTGTAQVSAAGDLSSFGTIGVGCGINWQEDVSFGGGLQAGSSTFGLGGGYTITPHNMSIGAGIGYVALNASANIQFAGKDDGTFELTFTSSMPFACVPGVDAEGKSSVKCSTMAAAVPGY